MTTIYSTWRLVSAGIINIQGAILIIPLIEIGMGPVITLTAGVKLDSPHDDDKLRIRDLENPNNFVLGSSGRLSLDVNAKLGLIDLGIYLGYHQELVGIELFNSTSGSFADLSDPLTPVKEGLLRKVEELKDYLTPWGLAGVVIEAIAEGLEDAAAWVGDKTEEVGKAAEHAAQEVGKAVNQVSGAVSDAAKQAEQGIRDVGNDIADFFGWGGWSSVSVPSRRTLATRREGSVLFVDWNSSQAQSKFGDEAVNLSVYVVDGQLVIDGPDFTQNELVAKKKIWTSRGRKTKEKHKNVTHANQYAYRLDNLSGVETIVIIGTDQDDTILVDPSVGFDMRPRRTWGGMINSWGVRGTTRF